ncbi:MAG TPA: LacI family DNA-binding transcriptional regulator [Flavitalea sp.]|nr:LacI family DNA-binding transcriptional regulator [Flavitalea sp.]
MRKVSLKQVALAAGVSSSTVSLILNGKARQMRISESLEKKVTRMALKMGYQPNQLAISLRTGKSRMIGLVVESISGRFFASMAKVIEDEAEKQGYRVVYCSTENDAKKGADLIRMLAQRQVDGYLITPTIGMEEDVKALYKAGKPVVMLDSYYPDLDIPHVLVDNYTGAKLAAQELVKRGFRRIGFVNIDLPLIQMQQREAGYKDVLKQAGIRFSNQLVVHLPYDLGPEKAISRIADFIQGPARPEAIFFASNYLGLSGLEAIEKLGLRIPTDTAVICFDDADIFRLYPPGISSVQQPVKEIAAKAMQLLLDQLSGKKLSPGKSKILLKPSLVIRGSI